MHYTEYEKAIDDTICRWWKWPTGNNTQRSNGWLIVARWAYGASCVLPPGFSDDYRWLSQIADELSKMADGELPNYLKRQAG